MSGVSLLDSRFSGFDRVQVIVFSHGLSWPPHQPITNTTNDDMPESNAAAKRRQQKANRAAGIGDESGRIVRVKDPPKLSKCTVCQLELKITKTNTELIAHASSKHGSTLDACFPGAADIAKELLAASTGKKGGGTASNSGPTKKEQRKKATDNMDDLLSAGLSTGKKKGKK